MPTPTAEELVHADLAKAWQPFALELDKAILVHGWPRGANGKPMQLLLGVGCFEWVEADMPTKERKA
jgi:hypothetical protein